jgi:hypothetical protein
MSTVKTTQESKNSNKQRVESDRAGALSALTFAVFLATFAISMAIPNGVFILLKRENLYQFAIILISIVLSIILSLTLNLTGAFTELINSWYPDNLLSNDDKTKNFPEEPITTIPMTTIS